MLIKPKLPLIYTLTAGRVLNTKCVSDQSRPTFAQSHSQSQARFMFVTTLKNGQLGLHQNQSTFNNSQRASFTNGAYIASPISPPCVGKQLTNLFHTQLLLIFLVYTAMQHQREIAYFR